ncbi:MAG: hypothetical protein WDO71_19320 [Bacteroidota bacterium]
MQLLFQPGSLSQFDTVLKLQEGNITEKGEWEATAMIREYFDRYRSGDNSLSTNQSIKTGIQQILSLNMSAIENKNRKATNAAEKALTIYHFWQPLFSCRV